MTSKIQSKKSNVKRSVTRSRNLIATAILFLLMVTMFHITDTEAKAAEKMSQESKEFYSLVRYIATKEENKFFKNMPEEKRTDFIRQFWAIRDPNTATPVNEFKEEYLKRIEVANEKFTAGRAGWLTDRGKTYILMGPPRHEEYHPLGYKTLGFNPTAQKPLIIWHYPEIYFLFMDIIGDGDFQVQYQGSHHHGLVQEAFVKARQQLGQIENLFIYNLSYKKKDGGRFLFFTFDMDRLTFKEEEGKMVSELEIIVTVRADDFNTAFDYKKVHTITFGHNEKLPDKVTLKVPLDKMSKGKYFFFTSVQKMDQKEKVFLNKMIRIK